MKINLKAIGKIALTAAKLAVPAIQDVEDRAKDVAHLKGDAKKKAAIELVKAGMKASEDVVDKDLVDDAEFDAVLGELNDILVRLHHVAAKKITAPASASALGVHAGSTGE